MVSDRGIIVVYAMGLMKCCPFGIRKALCPLHGNSEMLNLRNSYNYLNGLSPEEFDQLINSHLRCYNIRMDQGCHFVLN